VAYIHSKRVLHCDIRHDNLLLDANLDLKLADFQGQHFSVDGEILLDALSLESTRAYLPRQPADHASVRTDLFALGCVIYFIMMGQEVFPDLEKSTDEDEIERRFREGDFPPDLHVCTAITAKCWKQLYSSARQVVTDLEAVREAITRGETPDSVARNVVSVPNGDASPLATWWLNGLCNDRQTPKTPPPCRQPVGFDCRIRSLSWEVGGVLKTTAAVGSADMEGGRYGGHMIWTRGKSGRAVSSGGDQRARIIPSLAMAYERRSHIDPMQPAWRSGLHRIQRCVPLKLEGQNSRTCMS
jgi:serine/threonine protein kinase